MKFSKVERSQFFIVDIDGIKLLSNIRWTCDNVLVGFAVIH